MAEGESDRKLWVLAETLFHPEGKNHFYLDGKALHNPQGLMDNLN
jgi:hypothetical protein